MVSAEDTSFEWLGGHVALDFTNTVTWRQSGLARERLQSYADLLRWSEQAEILAPASVVALRKTAASRPDMARAAHRDAMRARDELHTLFVAQATGQQTPPEVIRSINQRSRRTMAHIALQTVRRQITVGWEASLPFDRPVWPVLKATLELLTSPDLGHLRLCANPECGWLFLDQSRKQNRRWCSMRECGSRAKARAYYHRRRKLSSEYN